MFPPLAVVAAAVPMLDSGGSDEWPDSWPEMPELRLSESKACERVLEEAVPPTSEPAATLSRLLAEWDECMDTVDCPAVVVVDWPSSVVCNCCCCSI